jgi:mycothiol synthase
MTDTISAVPSLELPDAPPIEGLRFRRLADPSDYAALCSLLRDANVHDGVDWIPDAETLRIELENETDFDPRQDLIVADVHGRVVGYGRMLRQVRDGVSVYFSIGSVHPAWRRRGLGRAIVHANIARAREKAASVSDPGGRALRAWLMDSEAGAAELFRSEGYLPIRYSFGMRRELPPAELLPVAPLPDGLELRPVLSEHHRAIFEADNEAFRDHWGQREGTEEDFRAMFGSPELDTSLWRIAWEGDQVAGCVLTWIWRAENDALGIRRGWLERISVRRPWRRRGLASALIVSALDGLREAGMTEAMLGVDAENQTGALRLYETLGFVQKDRATSFQREW